MARKITDIYTEYKIIPTLEDHMLRVAAVASMICDNSPKPLDRETIVAACLLHDMANIIKFKWSSLVHFLEPRGISYWQNVQREFKEKYGEDEHKATLKIAEEIGASRKVIETIGAIDFFEIPRLSEKAIEIQVVAYADSRVNPFGIVSTAERFTEAKKRYPQIKVEDWERNEVIMRKVESDIFIGSSIRPEDINDRTAAPIIEELKNFVIK
jgi:hypothetical protein